MFVVAQKTFAWGSFRLFGKVPRSDVMVGLMVAAITVLADLAIAVVAGVIISALVFAWEHAKRITVVVRTTSAELKEYDVTGTLFFASVAAFGRQFSPMTDPGKVEIDFRNARLIDHSAIEAVNGLAERYRRAGKKLKLRHLSSDCRLLLDNAADMIEIDYEADPQYPVADNKLG